MGRRDNTFQQIVVMTEMFSHDGLRRQRTRLLLSLRVACSGGPSLLPRQPADALADLSTSVDHV